MKVLLAGGSGFIGSALKQELLRQGHGVRSLTRGAGGDYYWNAQPGSVPLQALEWADALVSLNGASLSHVPWTRAYRDLIYSSRVDATTALAQAIAACAQPPEVWVSGSAIGIYGERGDQVLDESAAPGRGFLAQVTSAWEEATRPAGASSRVVLARTGVVLDQAGALKPLALATRLGLGSRLGPGTQWWGWVGLADEVRAIVFALENPALHGPVNLVGPVPARCETISRALAQSMHRPHLFAVPSRLIRTVMAGADELLLDSQKVIPQVLLDAGFHFIYSQAADAIRAAWADPVGSVGHNSG